MSSFMFDSYRDVAKMGESAGVMVEKHELVNIANALGHIVNRLCDMIELRDKQERFDQHQKLMNGNINVESYEPKRLDQTTERMIPLFPDEDIWKDV